MLRSAALRLSLYYLALIMGLSIGFSFFLYHISNNELDRSLERPGFVTKLVTPAYYEDFRTDRLATAQSNLRGDLVSFNLLILLVGGVVSWALAWRTLQPIDEAVEAQSRFTADASHELRTPLTAMQTEIEVALRNKQLTKQQAVALLGSNLEEVTKLRSLAEALLKLARDGENNIELAPIDAEDIVTEAVTRVYKSAQAKKISIETALPPIKVEADRDALTEVVCILLDNAIKFSPSKSAIEITGTIENQQAYINVIDHGPGIAKDELPKIFERFYRSDNARSKKTAGGYGLGLSIADRLMDLQKGNIKVASALKQGSTFTLILPIAASST